MALIGLALFAFGYVLGKDRGAALTLEAQRRGYATERLRQIALNHDTQ